MAVLRLPPVLMHAQAPACRQQLAQAMAASQDRLLLLDASDLKQFDSSALAVEITGTPDGKPLPARYVPDITRARTELALTVNYPLPEALRRTLAWHRAKL